MRAMAVHDRTLTGPAYCALDRFEPVDVAVTGAKVAVFEALPRKGHALCQFARLGQFQIGGSHGFYHTPVRGGRRAGFPQWVLPPLFRKAR